MAPFVSLRLNDRERAPARAALAAILLCAWAAAGLPAQEENKRDLFKLSLEELLDVVVTPSKMAQERGRVTQKVDVIDAGEIRRVVSGNRNACEAIAALPGAAVSVLSRNDANWGTYGGIGPKYSTYMLQGVPLDAFVDPMALDLNAIERIEVQRGPASVFYPNYLSQDFAGNQSPLAGTVNLIPKQRVEARKTVVDASFGSYNTLTGRIFHQDRLRGFNYFCGAAHESSDYADYGAEGSWLNMEKPPAYVKRKIFAGLTWYPARNEDHALFLFAQGTWHDGDTGRVQQQFGHRYGLVNAGYEVDVSRRVRCQAQFGLRSYERSWQDDAGGGETALAPGSGVDQMIVPAGVTLSWKPGRGHAISAGIDIQRASYRTWSLPSTGPRVYGNVSEAQQVGFFAQEEWQPSASLLLRAGLRQARIRNRAELSGGAPFGDGSRAWGRLLWSLGARFAPAGRIALYANAGSGFAAPGLKSIAGTIPLSDWGVVGRDGQLPNSELKPEKGIAADAGLDLALPSRIRCGARAFFTKVRDAIIDVVVSRDPSQSRSINSGFSQAWGIEIEAEQRLGSRLEWFVNATVLRSEVRNDLDPDQDGVRIPFSPTFIANLGLRWEAPFGLVLSPAMNYNDGFYDGTARSARAFYRPGLLFNLKAEQPLVRRAAFRLDGVVELYNIADNRFDLPWQFRNPGFAVQAGIRSVFP
jgi:outer membrane receptor protein involved in Fe transport